MNTYNIGDTVEVYTFNEKTGKISIRIGEVVENPILVDKERVCIKAVGVKGHPLSLGGRWPDCWLTFREAQEAAMRFFRRREQRHSTLAAKASERYYAALRQKAV